MNQAKKVKLFSEMYNKYYARLLRTMPKLTFDFEERDDIAQETFQRVWQALQADKYEELADPFTWIYKIAIGASQRLLQTKQRQIPVHVDIDDEVGYNPSEESDDFDESIFTNDPEEMEAGLVDYNTPEAVLMREQAEDELDEQVDELEDRYREILAMHYYDGMTYEEISAKLALPMETIRTRLRRAREILKSLLGEEDESERAATTPTLDEYSGAGS